MKKRSNRTAHLLFFVFSISACSTLTNASPLPKPNHQTNSAPEAVTEKATSSENLTVSKIVDLGTITQYGKQEITFDVFTLAINPQLPFDSTPPNGIDGTAGISVNGVFTSPTGKIWSQPAFYYRFFDEQIKAGRDWLYPTNRSAWKIRFSPDEVGTWQYYIKARDQTGVTQTETFSFNVTTSTSHGFIKASKTDPRYFEYSDGIYFPALGINSGLQWLNPSSNQNFFEVTGQNNIQVVRTWLTMWSIFGSTWNPWYGSRNDYDGYLPRAGIFTNGLFTKPMSQMRLVYADNNSYWFDACRAIGAFDTAPAVKQNTQHTQGMDSWQRFKTQKMAIGILIVITVAIQKMVSKLQGMEKTHQIGHTLKVIGTLAITIIYHSFILPSKTQTT